MRTSLALALGLLLVGTPVLAGTRDRDLRDSTPTPAPTPSPFVPTFPSFSNTSGGSIHSGASAQTNSGGNSGGNVTTGDQSSTVKVVNVGPTNTGGGQATTPAPQPAPEPQCSGRDCPRGR
ncbi:MAG TPA: hypothetical protein VJJ20_03415 [Candidatus Paceibacterota bacterium]